MHKLFISLVQPVAKGDISTQPRSGVVFVATIYTSLLQGFSESFTYTFLAPFTLVVAPFSPQSTPLITSTKLFKYYFYS